MKTLKLISLKVLIVSIVLSGCGGSEAPVAIEVPTAPPLINQAKAFDGPLTTGNQQNAERYIKNGIFASVYANSNLENSPTTANDVAVPSSFSGNYSTTNTSEQGVDEADRMEYDGNFLYLATYQQWIDGAIIDPMVRIMQRNQDSTLTELDKIEIEFKNDNIEGLYLYQDRLAVVSNDYPVHALTDIAIQPWFNDEASIGLSIHDVTNPASNTKVTSLKIDGMLLSSRRIENQLYIVSSYTPYIENLDSSATSDAALLENYNVVVNTPASAIMPKIRVGQQSIAMNEIEDCYIPAGATVSDGHAQLITVTRINLETPSDTQSTCLSVYAFMAYTSQDSLYIASNLDTNETQFHKISLSDMQYQASGKVAGSINSRSNPSLRIDEEDGHLRVVSSDYTNAPSIHKLTILKQNGNELQKVSELPNESNTEVIGKPGEEIYAVRFIEDKAYIVTFEVVDPLYVIDLSDQLAPFIAGSLEIPGFSSYLQPLKNSLILGVGQAVQLVQIPQSGVRPTIAPVSGGMKISLFDARDPANPIELTTIETNYAYTPVEFNYKALTVLESNGAYRFAMPIEQWENIVKPNFPTFTNSLMLLETDTTVNTPELTLVKKITVEATENHYVYSGEDRSVLHDDAVYYIHGNQIWLADWLTDATVVGPF